MKPTIEKITKPENIEVEQLATLTRRESRRQLLSNLQEDTVLIVEYDRCYLLWLAKVRSVPKLMPSE